LKPACPLRCILLFFSVCLILGWSGLPVAAAHADVHEAVLENGLRVIVYPRDGDPPLASVVLWVGAGAADDPPGQGGLAHLLVHLVVGMDESSGGSGGGLGRQVAAMGGTFNAATAYDYTVFWATVPAEHTPTVLRLLAAVPDQSVFGPAALERQRTVASRQQEFFGSDPRQAALSAMLAAVFRGHPYGRDAAEIAETVPAITVQDALAFLARHYVPEQMAIVVVGAVEPEAVFRWIEEAFGQLPARPVVARQTAPPEPLGEAIVLHQHRESQETLLYLAWQGPPAAHADAAAMDLIAGLLGTGRGSRLEQRFRAERVSAAGLVADYVSYRDAGLLLVGGHVPAGSEALAERLILEEIARLQDAPPDPEELDRVRAVLDLQFRLAGETHEQLALAIADALGTMGDWRTALDEPNRLAAVSAEQVAAAARRWLPLEARARLTVGPQPPPGWEGAGEGSGRTLPLRSPQPVRLVLDNGHVVILQPRPQSPVVAILTLARAGQRYEPVWKAGLAEATQRLLLEGTQALSAEELFALLESRGAVIEGTTEADFTTFTLLARPEVFAELLPLYAQVLHEPALDEQALVRVREELMLELLADWDDPLVRAEEGFLAQLYGEDHPYGTYLEQRLTALGEITPDDVAVFHRAHYQPARLVTAVVGPIDVEKTAALLAQVLGGYANAEADESLRGPQALREPVEGPVERRWHVRSDVSAVALGFPAPIVQQAEDLAVLDVVSHVVLKGFTSLLFDELRQRRALSYHPDGEFVLQQEGGYFLAKAVTLPEQEAIERALDAILRAFTTRLADVDEQVVEEAKARAINAYWQRRQAARGHAELLAFAEALGFGFQVAERYPQVVQGVTLEQIAAWAQELFRPERAVRSVVLPLPPE